VILATRPWSLTAAAVPVLLTCAVELETLRDMRVLQLLGMGLFAQAGSNLINTFWDYEQGVDKDEKAGDRTILDEVMAPWLTAFWGYTFMILSALCTLTPVANEMPLSFNGYTFMILQNQQFQYIFCLGAFLGVTYTMPPLKLKYRALGDIVIMLCFGPIIMQACSVVLTNAINPELYAYSVPVALMTEGILWAGNTRDIVGDAEAGVRTVQNTIGYKKSADAYKVILILSYVSALALVPLTWKFGTLLTLITVPIAKGTLDAFTDDNLAAADERNAQLHLPFGMMMVFGILLEAQIKAKPEMSYWVWVLGSFFGTLATLAMLKFAQCKLAPSLDVDWGNYNTAAFDNLYGPVYGVSGTSCKYFVAIC
jgi:1,4-dihydroxy-2-naphthoate octaprenyltransferase